MQSRGSSYAIIFTTVLSIVCALMLTGISRALAGRQLENRLLDEKKNIVGVLKIVEDVKKAPREDIEGAYAAHIRKEERNGVTLYTYHDAGETKAYAFVVDGMGLWAPVKGVLAVEPDLKTIRGVRFYQHEETPGLGGRIEEEGFTSQFENKSIIGPDGTPGIRIVSSPKADNEVDAISGATLTCDGVERFVTEDIQAFLKVMKAEGTQ